jgi:hypothetical protein
MDTKRSVELKGARRAPLPRVGNPSNLYSIPWLVFLPGLHNWCVPFFATIVPRTLARDNPVYRV